MMRAHLSVTGWKATLARLAGLLRPQVETVAVSVEGNDLQIQELATCATVGLGLSPDRASSYMVVEARIGGGGPPPSIEACDLWGRDVIEVGRLALLCTFVLTGLQVYPREVPCHTCGGTGLSSGQSCPHCKGAKAEPDADAVPWYSLPGWKQK